MTSERIPQDVLRELRGGIDALIRWRWGDTEHRDGEYIRLDAVRALIDKAIAEAPDSPPAKGAGEALAMALADTGYVDPHPTEQYQLVETLPILAALRQRGFVVLAAPDTLSEKPGLDVERLTKALFGMGNQLKNVLHGEAVEIEHVLAEEIAFAYARLGEGVDR